MAAGVSLARAEKAVGHSGGTTTGDVVRGLRALGVDCAFRLRRVSRTKPVMPRRAVVLITSRHPRREHWMLLWDGEIFDPGQRWPEAYRDWRITSYLEIL